MIPWLLGRDAGMFAKAEEMCKSKKGSPSLESTLNNTIDLTQSKPEHSGRQWTVDSRGHHCMEAKFNTQRLIRWQAFVFVKKTTTGVIQVEV
jgi:hypothetical protein